MNFLSPIAFRCLLWLRMAFTLREKNLVARVCLLVCSGCLGRSIGNKNGRYPCTLSSLCLLFRMLLKNFVVFHSSKLGKQFWNFSPHVTFSLLISFKTLLVATTELSFNSQWWKSLTKSREISRTTRINRRTKRVTNCCGSHPNGYPIIFSSRKSYKERKERSNCIRQSGNRTWQIGSS